MVRWSPTTWAWIWAKWGFPDSSVGKESACNSGNLGSIPVLGRSPGEGKGDPLQYSGLENSMGCIVHGVRYWATFTFRKITKEGEPGVLPSMGSQESDTTQQLKNNNGLLISLMCTFFVGNINLKKIKELPQLVTSMAHLMRYPVHTNSSKGQVRAHLWWDRVHNKHTNTRWLLVLPQQALLSVAWGPWGYDLCTPPGPWHKLCLRKRAQVNNTAPVSVTVRNTANSPNAHWYENAKWGKFLIMEQYVQYWTKRKSLTAYDIIKFKTRKTNALFK